MTDRTFKTRKFAKDAGAVDIADDELCAAIAEARAGQADDLGGGVFKKRLNRNEHRAIILSNIGVFWVYEYIFAKKDRDNITPGELAAFCKLAADRRKLTLAQIAALIAAGQLIEICHDR
jgi:hypothetical protein